MHIAVLVRLVLLAVNGITVAVFFQIVFYSDNASTVPATVVAYVLAVRAAKTTTFTTPCPPSARRSCSVAGCLCSM